MDKLPVRYDDGPAVEHSMQMNPHSGVLPGLKVMVDRAELGQAGNDVEPREGGGTRNAQPTRHGGLDVLQS